MKFGYRKPSLNKRIAARTSLKRYVRNSLGLKAPRGWGWLTNPKKAAYNRVYNRTTIPADKALAAVLIGLLNLVVLLVGGAAWAVKSRRWDVIIPVAILISALVLWAATQSR